ncbi:MAG: cation diffusion facilitator family transporter [Polyangiaceae bacterium]|nr:cation diffusion facilitator family transporter [Polyangiaceae bacterium]
MAGGGGDPKKVVKAAMFANGGIAVAKFIAAFFSGSATMMAEGVHSVADTTNQGLLLVGMVLSSKRADDRFQFGRGAESYFWAFIVALLLFFLGGVYAIYEGVHKLGHVEAPGSPWIALAVLVVSIALEGGSFLVAWKEFAKERGNRSYREALFEGKDPIIPVVLLEDTGALVGLVVALVAVFVTWLTGNAMFDAIGSIVIGALLCVIGVLLARDTRDLLIGEGITKSMRDRVVTLAETTPGVESVRQLLSLHLGPSTILLALKVRFQQSFTVAEVEKATDVLEDRIRAEIPAMKRIFVEPDSDYDASLDRGEDDAQSAPVAAS